MTVAESTILSRIHFLLQYLPHAGIVSSILVISLLALLGKNDILPYALSLLIPVIIVSVLYIWKRKSLTVNIETLPNCLHWLDIPQKYFVKLWVILLCSIIIWLLVNGTRDGVYLCLFVILCVLTIFQIFLKKFDARIVILQLAAIALVHVLTKQFCYYYYYAGTDCLVHVMLAKSIVENGFLNPDLLGSYGNFALMHITIAVSTILTDLQLNYAHWISVSIPLLIVSLLIYYIANSLTNSKRIAALAFFFYLMTPIVLNYIPSAAPRTLSTMAFFVVLYFFFRKNTNPHTAIIWVCSALMTLYMILAHHAQFPLIIIVMTILLLAYLIYFRTFTKVQKGIVLLFYSIPILYYLFTYLGNIIGILKTNFFGVLESTSLTELNTVQSSTFGLVNFINLMSGLLMLAVILFGLYYIVMPNNQKSKVIILWPLTLLLFAVFIPGVADAFTALSMMEQIGRLQIVLTPFFAVAMAIGLLVFGYIVSRGFNLTRIGCFVIIIFCILLVIASPVISNSRDSSLFIGTDLVGTPNSFNEGEVISFKFMTEEVESESKIWTDYESSRYFTNKRGMQNIGESYYIFPYGILSLFSVDNTNIPQNIYILFSESKYRTVGRLHFLDSFGDCKTVKSTIDNDKAYHKNTYVTRIIYDNGGSVLMYSL